MIKRLLSKKNQQPVIRDRVIVFDDEAKTCEILPVEEENEEVVRTANKTFPRQDLTLTLSKAGRVYVFRAPSRIIELTEHLAKVERNTIIRQIAQYKRPFEETKVDWFKFIVISVLAVIAIVGAVK